MASKKKPARKAAGKKTRGFANPPSPLPFGEGPLDSLLGKLVAMSLKSFKSTSERNAEMQKAVKAMAKKKGQQDDLLRVFKVSLDPGPDLNLGDANMQTLMGCVLLFCVEARCAWTGLVQEVVTRDLGEDATDDERSTLASKLFTKHAGSVMTDFMQDDTLREKLVLTMNEAGAVTSGMKLPAAGECPCPICIALRLAEAKKG